MDFQDVPVPRRRSRAADWGLMAAAVGFTPLVFRHADDFDRGRALLSDCFGFTAAFVVVGLFLGWDPPARRDGRPSRLEAWQTPAFLALALAYLYLVFRAGYVQPGATGLAVVVLVAALAAILVRMP